MRKGKKRNTEMSKDGRRRRRGRKDMTDDPKR